ncbi:MAG: hypothetical protein QFX32_02345 [Methanolinea sp.]|nr:hypothetical protein [Methanolinea sp.]
MGEMREAGVKILLGRGTVALILGIPAFLCGYFSIGIAIGNATVFDPRDLLVVSAAALAGPAGGGLSGFLAGLGGPDISVMLLFYTIGGTLSGFLARILTGRGEWLGGSALGLGACYPLAGLLAIAKGYWDWIAPLALQSLVMQCVSILVLSIIQSLGLHAIIAGEGPGGSLGGVV